MWSNGITLVCYCTLSPQAATNGTSCPSSCHSCITWCYMATRTEDSTSRPSSAPHAQRWQIMPSPCSWRMVMLITHIEEHVCGAYISTSIYTHADDARLRLPSRAHYIFSYLHYIIFPVQFNYNSQHLVLYQHELQVICVCYSTSCSVTYINTSNFGCCCINVTHNSHYSIILL